MSNRRSFFRAASGGVLGVTAVATTVATLRYLVPVSVESPRSVFRCELTEANFTPYTVDLRYQDEGVWLVCLPWRSIRRSEVVRYGISSSDFRKVEFSQTASSSNAVTSPEEERILFALRPICTHLGCAIFYDSSAQIFRCPCHGSTFALDGSRQTGPATTDLALVPLIIRAIAMK